MQPNKRRGYPSDSVLYSNTRGRQGYSAKGAGGNVPGSQPERDADGFFYIEGVLLPWWWPFDPITRQPIHKLFRAMSKDYNELWPVRDRPHDYPDRDLTNSEHIHQAIDVFDAVDTGSRVKSPFIHCSGTEGGARWYLNAGKDRKKQITTFSAR